MYRSAARSIVSIVLCGGIEINSKHKEHVCMPHVRNMCIKLSSQLSGIVGSSQLVSMTPAGSPSMWDENEAEQKQQRADLSANCRQEGPVVSRYDKSSGW